MSYQYESPSRLEDAGRLLLKGADGEYKLTNISLDTGSPDCYITQWSAIKLSFSEEYWHPNNTLLLSWQGNNNTSGETVFRVVDEQSSLVVLGRDFLLRPVWWPLQTQTSGDLHSDFNVVKPENRSKVFKKGAVIRSLWAEPRGEDEINSDWNERNFWKVRWFLIVREGKSHCIAVPVRTYHGKGPRPDIDHSYLVPLVLVNRHGHSQLPNRPLHLVLESKSINLSGHSTIDFSKRYTLEHNIRIHKVGRLAKEDGRHFDRYIALEGAQMDRSKTAEKGIEPVQSLPESIEPVQSLPEAIEPVQSLPEAIEPVQSVPEAIGYLPTSDVTSSYSESFSIGKYDMAKQNYDNFEQVEDSNSYAKELEAHDNGHDYKGKGVAQSELDDFHFDNSLGTLDEGLPTVSLAQEGLNEMSPDDLAQNDYAGAIFKYSEDDPMAYLDLQSPAEEKAMFIVFNWNANPSSCVPIRTYNGKACTEIGVKSRYHGIIYADNSVPILLRGERQLGFSPIKAKLNDDEIPLLPEARVNYSEIVQVEHDRSPVFIGNVVQDDLKDFRMYVSEAQEKIRRAHRSDGSSRNRSTHISRRHNKYGRK